MFRIAASFICFTVFAACAAPAADTRLAAPAPIAAPIAVAEADPDIDMNETVCRKEITTGTRFARKVCRTRQEWEDAAKAGGDVVSGSTRRALQQNREDRR